MYRFTRTTLVRAAAIALIIPVLASCKKKDEAYADPNASTTTIPPAAPAATPIKVAEIDVGKGLNPDKTLKDNTDDFGVRDTIYAAVKTQEEAAIQGDHNENT